MRSGTPTLQGASAEYLAALVEGATDAIFSEDLEGRIRSWNRGAELAYGYSSEQVVGRPVGVLFAGGNSDLLNGSFERACEGVARASETDCVHLDRAGQPIDVAVSVSPIRDERGEVIGRAYICRDISARKRLEQRLERLANLDDLTGLANRRRFLRELKAHLERCQENGWAGALLMLDLDELKAVNDTLGHSAGDRLIREAGAGIRQALRSDEFVARLGGDEFGVVLPQADRSTARATAKQLLTRVRSAGTATSIGIAPIEGPIDDKELMIRVDVALYAAKDLGGDGFCLYGPELDRRR